MTPPSPVPSIPPPQAGVTPGSLIPSTTVDQRLRHYNRIPPDWGVGGLVQAWLSTKKEQALALRDGVMTDNRVRFVHTTSGDLEVERAR